MCKGKLARKSVGRLILTLRTGKFEEDEQNITLVARPKRHKKKKIKKKRKKKKKGGLDKTQALHVCTYL
jgi:hypothetical protein